MLPPIPVRVRHSHKPIEVDQTQERGADIQAAQNESAFWLLLWGLSIGVSAVVIAVIGLSDGDHIGAVVVLCGAAALLMLIVGAAGRSVQTERRRPRLRSD